MAARKPTDVVAEAKDYQARQAARAKAIAAPQKRRGTTKSQDVAKYANAAFDGETDALRMQGKGGRNHRLYLAARNLGEFVAHGLSEIEIRNALLDCCKTNGLIDDPDDGIAQCRKTIRNGLRDGMAKPRDLSDVGSWVYEPYVIELAADGEWITKPLHDTGTKREKHSTPVSSDRVLAMTRMTSIQSSVPQWVWEHEGIGCIQLGTLTMLAGRPATGKSTAARWFAAQLTRGLLPGVWQGYPVNVAACFFEEDNEYMVKPSMLAAGADVSRVMLPHIRIGDDMEGQLLARADEQDLTNALVDNEIRALFVDPIMSTFGGAVDINKNNEVREYLQPFVRIANAINGIVVAVTHLNKSNNRDVLAAMNGSSAFGEIPRAVIGFMEKGKSEPERVMEQVKNSAGPLPNPFTYKLIETDVLTDDGLSSTMTRFEIIGQSDVSLVDIVDGNMEGEGTTEISRAVRWLEEYLRIEQPASVAETKQVARQQADISERTLQRARIKLGVKAVGAPLPEKPHRQAWCLPDYKGYES